MSVPRGRLAASTALAAATLLAAAGLLPVPAGAATSAATPAAACPWVGSTQPISTRVDQVMAKMTVDQEVALATGAGGSSYVGLTPSIGALCIPTLDLEDGPAGVADGMTGVTQLPAPVSAAATWDTAAETSYGRLVGGEEAAKGTTVDLGPTVNIVRDPRWGRAFESIGEDPYLNGTLGAAEIRGVQSTGVMAQVKHLAAYNQETYRNTPSDDVVVDQRTLQEIYLPAFEQSVGPGAASSVMCAYSTVNGTYACQNPGLIDQTLHGQFGSQAFVTSDWGATHSTAPSADAGLDQDMPGNDGYYGPALASAVASGQVSRATLDAAARRILTQEFAFGLFDNPPQGSPAQTATTAAHVSAARSLAEEGSVLLKNSGSLLPFGSATHSIAVIGADASTNVRSAGGGSAAVNSSGTVTPLTGITNRAGSTAKVTYNDGSSASSAAAAAAAADVAVVFAGTSEGEGSDLSGISLSSADDNLISQVAAANPHTVVVLDTGSAVTMPWLPSVAGVLEAWYPGQEDGNAIAALLFGDVDPSGHLPVTFPASLSQVPASTTAQWPGTNGTVQYSEGLDVGYRHYDAQGLTPLFPFGYGLSYTSFAFSGLTVSALPRGGAATVSATVTNTGTRSGADVAQLYVTAPASAGEPPRRLQGFQRVELAAGASARVSFPLTEADLHHWNASSSGWTTDTGDYTVRVGDSSANLPLTGTLSVTADRLGHPLTLTSPGPQEGLAGRPVSLAVTAQDTTSGQTPAFTATGLPAGTSISAGGTISGTPTTPGTTTVTVTAHDAAGAADSASFVWTVAPQGAGVPTTPLIGNGGSCLDLAADNNTNGTKVELYHCNGTNGQQWTQEPDGTVRADGKCLDVKSAGTADGTPVQLYDCNGTAAQVWRAGTGDSLVNSGSGKCLDVPGGTTVDGTALDIAACNGTAAQSWVSPAGAGPVTGIAGLCLDVRSAGTADGTAVQLWTCNGTGAQQWTVAADGTLQALGKCLDVAGAGTANGTLVQLWTCNGTGAQQWTYDSAKKALVNPESGRCLDDPSGNTTPGTQQQIYDCNGTAAQQWTLP